MVPQSVAFIPAFVQTLDGTFVAAGHIVTLVSTLTDGEPAFRATTADHRTFNLSPHIAEQLLRGAARDTGRNPMPQGIADPMHYGNAL